MILSRAALRAIGAVFCTALATIWAIAWFAPGIGLQYDDGAYLVVARSLATGAGYVTANLPAPIAQTKVPPLFPAVLGLWSLVSLAPAWLKALPVVCSIAWFWLTWILLQRLGASRGGAALVVGLTAASPGVIALGANLFPEPLFALLITASLIFLLDGRPALAGAAAGLATLTRTAGVPLLAACMITLVVRRRFRDAVLFTAPAILLVAPWFGWALAHGAHDASSGINSYSASNIFTALEPGDKLIVVLRNLEMLFASPFTAISGIETPVAAAITAILVAICIIVRRHLLPDLLVLLYAGMLLVWIWPPDRFIVPILPFVFWILWRVAASARHREPIAAFVVLLTFVPLWQGFRRIPDTRRSGAFALNAAPQVAWSDLERFFSAIRQYTPADATLAANLDPLFYFETGRKCVRGFDPNGFDLFYSPRPYLIAPDQLSLALYRNGVNYVALTPGDVTESDAPLHTAAEALERGGVLEPFSIPGLPRGYELLRVVERRP